MQNSAYLQKRIISAFIKTLKIKHLSSKLIINNLTKPTTIVVLTKKDECVRVQVALHLKKKKSALREICKEKMNIPQNIFNM